jgi:hypothetical protein
MLNSSPLLCSLPLPQLGQSPSCCPPPQTGGGLTGRVIPCCKHSIAENVPYMPWIEDLLCTFASFCPIVSKNPTLSHPPLPPPPIYLPLPHCLPPPFPSPGICSTRGRVGPVRPVQRGPGQWAQGDIHILPRGAESPRYPSMQPRAEWPNHTDMHSRASVVVV